MGFSQGALVPCGEKTMASHLLLNCPPLHLDLADPDQHFTLSKNSKLHVSH